MTVIDPTTSLGKVRLRIGDFQDLPILPDSVITSALTECDENVPRASALCAHYILATLTSKTHRKMAQLETWGDEQFKNYVQFLKLTVLNPHMMAISPVPYTGMADVDHPLMVFVEEWNASYCPGYVDLSTGSL